MLSAAQPLRAQPRASSCACHRAANPPLSCAAWRSRAAAAAVAAARRPRNNSSTNLRPAAAAAQPQQPHSDALLSSAQVAAAPLLQRALQAAVAGAAAAALCLPAGAVEYSAGGKLLFDPMAYSGRWYEVASLKKGFAGEGQADCHCTQGIYVPQDTATGSIRLQVNTFCVHGGPGGRLSGIQGSVSCANPALLEVLPEFLSEQERADAIVEKCVLTFDSLPFIPPEPYNVIRTDYTTYALVQGDNKRSFVQIYARMPNPGPVFIQEKKAVLAGLGYPADEIRDTPQDCPEMPQAGMMRAMNAGMAASPLMPSTTPPAKAYGGYDLGPAADALKLGGAEEDRGPVKGIAFDSLRNPLESLGNVLRLLSGS